MPTLNKVLLIGNLTRNPERRALPSGLALAEFGLAVNERHKTKDGTTREEVLFVDVTVWGKAGEACAEYLTKGAPVFIEGRMKLDQWEKDGQKRSKIAVIADRVQFLGQGKGNGEKPQGEARRPSSVPNKPVAQAELQVDIGPDDDSSIPF